jgi:hypothetical protein
MLNEVECDEKRFAQVDEVREAVTTIRCKFPYSISHGVHLARRKES